MSNQYNDTLASHNDIDHASQIVELDTQKFRIAKAASDLEIEGERLEQELKGLRGRLQELELQGVEGDEQARASREVDDPTMWVCSPPLYSITEGIEMKIQTVANTLLFRRLKLKVYRSLGIDVEADDAGNYNRAVIRNTTKGDVHVVNIDPKFSRFFYANYFWQTM